MHRRAGRVLGVLLLTTAAVTGCRDDQPSSAAPARVGPLTPLDPDRLPDQQREAIAALAATASPDAPSAHTGHGGHAGGGPTTTVALSPLERREFEAQWATASAAVPILDSQAEASAAGYTRAAVQGAGVGVHWVNWTLIDRPFDPARPSMLLFDERDRREELFGFSYWVRSPAPDGFAGPNDVWHQHTHLCIVNGWVDREGVATPDDCAGEFLAGADLWMLHAWVVPEHENQWGEFATLHPALCPGPADAAPDISRCEALSIPAG